MPELQLLRAAHAPAVLAFELANRAYFAATITDRGDAFFEHYAERHAARLAEQERGEAAFYVLVDEDGSVLGRFNLVFAANGTAVLGYRVAEAVTGRGLATAAVRDLCRYAASAHRLRTIRAATADANVASRRVLEKTGFAADGPADPAAIGGKTGRWYRLDLARAAAAS
jgi:RimJ/RimL family protein N-acetyltransferase